MKKEKKKLKNGLKRLLHGKRLKNNEPLTDEWNYEKKREIISQIDKEKVYDFFEKYEEVYFPNVSEMTPIEKLENVLTQFYNLKMPRGAMKKDEYAAILNQIGAEYYILINDAENEKLKKIASESRIDEVNKITSETKEAVKESQEKTIKEQGEGAKDER